MRPASVDPAALAYADYDLSPPTSTPSLDRDEAMAAGAALLRAAAEDAVLADCSYPPSNVDHRLCWLVVLDPTTVPSPGGAPPERDGLPVPAPDPARLAGPRFFYELIDAQTGALIDARGGLLSAVH
jgi:hypothetical protein